MDRDARRGEKTVSRTIQRLTEEARADGSHVATAKRAVSKRLVRMVTTGEAESSTAPGNLKSMTFWKTRKDSSQFVNLQELHKMIHGRAFQKWSRHFEQSATMQDVDRVLLIDELVSPFVSVSVARSLMDTGSIDPASEEMCRGDVSQRESAWSNHRRSWHALLIDLCLQCVSTFLMLQP